MLFLLHNTGGSLSKAALMIHLTDVVPVTDAVSAKCFIHISFWYLLTHTLMKEVLILSLKAGRAI